MNKKGISLVVLMITIVVMVILATTAVLTITTSADSSVLSVFVNNVLQLEESVTAKYILDGQIPYDENTTPLTKDELLLVVLSEYKDVLTQELVNNGESDSSLYYILDVVELGFDKFDTGTKKKGEDDIYVISSSTLKVYYLYGIEYEKKIYFSVNSEMINMGDLSNNNIVSKQDSSETKVVIYNGVKISRNNAKYTNDLGITIESSISGEESIKIGFHGIESKDFILNEGEVNISFSSLENLNSQNILSTNFTDDELAIFYSLKNENRVLYVYKYDGENIVGTYTIDVSNFDNVAPTIQVGNITVKDEFSILSASAIDSTNSLAVSGLSEIRYEYLTKKDGTSYYSNINIDEEYMKNKSKKVSLSNTQDFGLKIPSQVGSLEIYAIDKAGNIGKTTVLVSEFSATI